jgi:hypothetical protein
MTELAIPEAAAVAPRVPAPQLPVPAMDDIDSWTRIVVQVVRLAEEICDTPFVPDGLRGSAPAVSAAILSGREMGLGPMTSLANIDVIKGKPTQKPLLMRAMVQARGHKWIDVDVSDVRAVVKGCRKGETEWTEVTFTADQARKGGIDLGKYPADKLYARASSRLAKRKFADVIMGMAYSSDEAEDDDLTVDTATGEITSGPAAIEQAKPRTAQRKQRTQSPPPATSPTPPAASATPAQDAGGDLPPLPGEEEITAPVSGGDAREAEASKAGSPDPGRPDETDYDTPGTVTGPQITAIWTVLSNVYEFGKDEKDQARMVCGHIAGRDLESSKDLSRNEAKAVLDTLSHWQHQAAEKNEHPRTYMVALMVAGDGDAGELRRACRRHHHRQRRGPDRGRADGRRRLPDPDQPRLHLLRPARRRRPRPLRQGVGRGRAAR